MDSPKIWADFRTAQSLPVLSNIMEMRPAKMGLSINCKKASAVSCRWPCDALAQTQKRQKYSLKERTVADALWWQMWLCVCLWAAWAGQNSLQEHVKHNSLSASGQQLLQHQNRPLLSTPVISVWMHRHISAHLAFVTHLDLLMFSKQRLDVG